MAKKIEIVIEGGGAFLPQDTRNRPDKEDEVEERL